MSGFTVEILPVDITPFRKGNTGVDYVHRIAASTPGPTVMVNALTHGNELCGAHALSLLFGCELRPRRGILVLSFANVAAHQNFDPRNPTASRYVDEDLNRLWAPEILDGPRNSVELSRARELRPLVASADYLLDIHSMQSRSPALMLCGTQAKGKHLAGKVGVPAHVVADAGHKAGPRMRDFGAFADPASKRTALLVECGPHWQRQTVGVAIETTFRFLIATGTITSADAGERMNGAVPPQQVIDVSGPVTIKRDSFRFVADYQGLVVVAEAGTVIGYDGDEPVRTPYDNCVLIMPSKRLQKGQTAVRFGRIVA